MSITQMIKENKGTVIDVRTPMEFMGGNVAGSLNIPINEITSRLDELRKMQNPLILCCASGSRSGQVYNDLSSHGIDCYNAGSWLDVNYLKAQVTQV